MSVDNSELKELMSVSIDIVSILNELLKLENMVNVDYSEVDTDLKWNRQILRNRLDQLKELRDNKHNWNTAKTYLEKVE